MKNKLRDINLTPTDEILKNRLIKVMPETTRITLTASQSVDLDAFCTIADNLYDMMGGSVYEIGTNYRFPDDGSHRRGGRYSSDTRMYRSNNRGLEPFYDGQQQRICRCHIYFGNKARKCRTWCEWPGRKPQIIDPASGTNSRDHSRASSPTQKLN